MYNEKINISPENKVPRLAEVINPVNLPEAGFQSYAEFSSDALQKRDDFISGNTDNPDFDYSSLKDPHKWDSGIAKLSETIASIDDYHLSDMYSSATKSSLEFRRAEMEYVKTLSKLDIAYSENPNDDAIYELADTARNLNEQLYGRPNPNIVLSAMNAINANLEGKSLSVSAKSIYDELHNGFSWKNKTIPAFLKPTESELRLPSFEDESLAWAGEYILEKNAAVEAIIREFWQNKVQEFGEDYSCSPDDIVEAFQDVLQLLDPEYQSGVRIVINPDSTVLSWESSEMAVKVGAKRQPIKSAEQLFEKVLHELVVHGGRSINGLKTDLPVLGLGLFTDTPRPDYLTFEEGFATTIEEIVSGDKPEWDSAKLAYYINIDLAQKGYDFRSVFETTWRYSLLMGLNDDEEVSEAMVNKYQKTAYSSCVRTFRGNQTDVSDKLPIKPMTFNKDLAYLEGRVLAMNHIAELYKTKDTAGIDRLFMAKYDPTNPVQDNIVRLVLNR